MAGEAQKYLVRDPQGNVYGPADAELLREWVSQGRIVPGMAIAPRETREWMEAAEHPTIRDLLEERMRAAADEIVETPQGTADTGRGDAGMMVARPAAPERPAAPVGVPEIPYSSMPRVQNTLGIMSFIFGIAGTVSVFGMCFAVCACIILPVNVLINLTAVVLGIFGGNGADPGRSGGRLCGPGFCGGGGGSGKHDAAGIRDDRWAGGAGQFVLAGTSLKKGRKLPIACDWIMLRPRWPLRRRT